MAEPPTVILPRMTATRWGVEDRRVQPDLERMVAGGNEGRTPCGRSSRSWCRAGMTTWLMKPVLGSQVSSVCGLPSSIVGAVPKTHTFE